MKPNVKVSILCTTYNQEAYIAEALDSFLSQKTSFNYEILVNDDASTDSTPLILKKYEIAHPDKIRVFYQKRNLFSQGVNICNAVLLPEAKGEYIALCEGDDYWISSNKLQIQAECLDKHPECSECIHKAQVIDATTQKNKLRIMGYYGKEECLLKITDILQKWDIPTASRMLRKTVMNNYSKEWYPNDFPVGDFPRAIFSCMFGPIYYLPETMSIYRFQTPGSYTSSISNDPLSLDLYKRWLNMIYFLNEKTHFIYKKDFLAFAENYLKIVIKYQGFECLSNHFYKEVFSRIPLSRKICWLLIRIKRVLTVNKEHLFSR